VPGATVEGTAQLAVLVSGVPVTNVVAWMLSPVLAVAPTGCHQKVKSADVLWLAVVVAEKVIVCPAWTALADVDIALIVKGVVDWATAGAVHGSKTTMNRAIYTNRISCT